MKKLKDYIHFYLGCECLIGDKKEIDYIQMVNETGLSVCTGTNKNDIQLWYKTSSCKPILRPLSDMTEEEFIELFKKCSLFDLSECVFEFSESYEVWINAVHNGVVIDGIKIESGDCVMMMNNDGGYSPINPQSECMAWFLSKHFDLFELIDNDIAIDKTTYK